MSFNLIDIETWERKEYYEHYMNNVRCTYSLTAEIDITDAYVKSKIENKKIYPMFIYAITKCVNEKIEFRYSFDKNGNLGYFDKIDPSYTIMRKDNPEQFCSIWTEYDENFEIFYKRYEEDCDKYANAGKMNPKETERENYFFISALPEISFTGFNLNIYADGRFLLPIFTIGKYYKTEKRIKLPISIQVHHAVCDGFHVSKLIKEIESKIAEIK
ncbi:MAG: type A chloramphenicol O-acetyltransferase [Synergistaceae bacterium]